MFCGEWSPCVGNSCRQPSSPPGRQNFGGCHESPENERNNHQLLQSPSTFTTFRHLPLDTHNSCTQSNTFDRAARPQILQLEEAPAPLSSARLSTPRLQAKASFASTTKSHITKHIPFHIYDYERLTTPYIIVTPSINFYNSRKAITPRLHHRFETSLSPDTLLVTPTLTHIQEAHRVHSKELQAAVKGIKTRVSRRDGED